MMAKSSEKRIYNGLIRTYPETLAKIKKIAKSHGWTMAQTLEEMVVWFKAEEKRRKGMDEDG